LSVTSTTSIATSATNPTNPQVRRYLTTSRALDSIGCSAYFGSTAANPGCAVQFRLGIMWPSAETNMEKFSHKFTPQMMRTNLFGG
jgi:hypothetical protein